MSVLAKSLQLCPTLCSPMDGSPQAPLSMGFSRQEYWSGLLCSPTGDISNRNHTHVSNVSCIGRKVLYHWCHLGLVRETEKWTITMFSDRMWFRWAYEPVWGRTAAYLHGTKSRGDPGDGLWVNLKYKDLPERQGKKRPSRPRRENL